VQKIQASITHVLDSMTLEELAAEPTVPSVTVTPLAGIR
jgi:hypothetical protein